MQRLCLVCIESQLCGRAEVCSPLCHICRVLLTFLPNDFKPSLIVFIRNCSPRSVQLSINLRFYAVPMIRLGDSRDLEWPDITFLDERAR
jgi:hypothetical protein